MKGSSRNQAPAGSEERSFIRSLTHKLRRVVEAAWMPIIAETFYQLICRAKSENKAEVLDKACRFVHQWSTDLRSTLICDLARYVQNHQHEFSGNAVEWMTERLAEIWNGMLTEEDYLEWLAYVCDRETNLEKWRAPLWMNKASIEHPEELLWINKMNPRELDDGSLNEQQTDEIVRNIYIRYEAIWALKGPTSDEMNKMCDLHVLICQGGTIPPGLGSVDNAAIHSVEQLLPRSHRRLDAAANPGPSMQLSSLRPDPEQSILSRRNNRGRTTDKVVEEIRRIRYQCCDRARTMAELREEHKDYLIWNIVKSLPAEDQELFEHPRQWDGGTVSYALLLLGKHYGKNWMTVRDWRKEYRSRTRRGELGPALRASD